jgi:hypothetical protein
MGDVPMGALGGRRGPLEAHRGQRPVMQGKQGCGRQQRKISLGSQTLISCRDVGLVLLDGCVALSTRLWRQDSL